MKSKFILLLMIGTIILTGCDALSTGVGPQATPTNLVTRVPTTPPTATVPPATSTPVPIATTAPSANPLESLTKAFRAFSTVRSFRAKMTSATQVTDMEYVAPDRFHLTSAKSESFLIGSTFYLKVGTKWQKAPVPSGFDLNFTDPKKLMETLSVTTDVKFVGADVLDGAPMWVFEYTSTIKGPPAITVKSKVLSAVSDNLPRKMESESKSGKTTIIYSDYNNPTIAIAAPIP